MDTRLKKWIRWLKVIQDEVYQLVIAKDIFWTVQDLISKNKKIQKPSSFYRYLGNTYVSHVLIGIRRQVKIDKQSISFAKLLSEITDDPQRVSRKYYKALYKDSVVIKVVRNLADRHFDRFCGDDPAYISPIMVADDLHCLKDLSKKCEDFADKRIAHRDKSDPKTLLKFSEIDTCIEALDKLYVKYHQIFHASSMDTLMPTYQDDWQEIFDEPWRLPEHDYEFDNSLQPTAYGG